MVVVVAEEDEEDEDDENQYENEYGHGGENEDEDGDEDDDAGDFSLFKTNHLRHLCLRWVNRTFSVRRLNKWGWGGVWQSCSHALHARTMFKRRLGRPGVKVVRATGIGVGL